MTVSETDSLPSRRFHFYRGIFLITLGVLVVWMNNTFVIPLLMGAIFAIVLEPLKKKRFLRRLGVKTRALVITAVFAFSFLIPIGAITVLGAEEALNQIQKLQDGGFDPKMILEKIGINDAVTRLADLSPVSETQIRQLMTRGTSGIGEWFIKLLQGLVSSVPKAAFANLIILLTMYFLLVDGKRAIRFIERNSFFGPEDTQHVFNAVKSLCYSVVVASIAAGAAQSALIAVSCFITKTPNAILIALVAFVLSFLPVFGTLPVTLGLTAFAGLSGRPTAAIVFLVFIFLVGTIDNIVRPWVLKGGASLHPLIGFVAAFGALDTLGFFGVFIGPVVAGLFFTLLPMVTRTHKES